MEGEPQRAIGRHSARADWAGRARAWHWRPLAGMIGFERVQLRGSQRRLPMCGHVQTTEIQVRYGHTWQHRLRVGDRLPWGGNDVGVKGARSVLVEGIGGPCANCGEPVLYCETQIEDDVLRGVRVAAGGRFPPEGYLVVQP